MTAISAESQAVPAGAGQDWVFYREDIEGPQDTLAFSVNLPPGTTERAAIDALAQVVRAHGALRTRIVGTGARRSLILEPPGRAIEMLGWQACQAPDPPPGDLGQWHDDLMHERLDLASGAVRCVLARTPTHCRVVFRVHHSMCDGVAVNVVVRDFLSALSGRGLPVARRQACDYGFERNPETERRNLGRWLGTLAGAPANVTYTARRMVPEPGHGDRIAEFRLNREVTRRLQHAARAARSTFFALWLSLVHAWASQYTGEHDLILSMMTANRGHRDDYDIVANISLPLWLRVAGRPGDTFAQRLAAVRAALLERLGWTAYSPVDVFAALSDDAGRRGASFRPAVNTSLHIFGGPRVPRGGVQESDLACERSLAGPVRVVSTADLPESSWSDLRVESVVKGGELNFWIFIGQAVWQRRAPGQLVEDFVRVLTSVSEGGLSLPIEAAAVPSLGAAGLVQDRRSGSRLDLDLVASVVRGLPGVTSAAVAAAGSGPGGARIVAEVVVEAGSPAERSPGLLEREFRYRLPAYRGVAVPEVWHIRQRPP
jgi:hypothetical protein